MTTRIFRVRVDGLTDDIVTAFCKRHCSRFLIVHHTTLTENPHYHFYVETHFTQGNFSNKIKSDMKVTGSDYCNQQCDPDRKLEYLSYLFNTKKGNVPRLVTYDGFSPLDIATYAENAKTIAEEFQTKMKQKKKTQYDVVEAVLGRMDHRQLCFHEVVYDEVISVMKTMRIMARPHHVRDMIATIMAYGDDKKANKVIKELTLKFFSQNNT